MTKKLLKKYKEPDYGFVNEDNEICINVEKLWKENNEKVGGFISDFSLTHTHELLHLLIPQITRKQSPLVWEEKGIRALLKEKWNKKLEKLYMEDEE